MNLKETQLTLTNDLIPYANLILGKTTSQLFTLYKCWENEHGIKKSGFNIEFILKGYHFHNENDIIFDSVTLSYPSLNKWANIPGIGQRVANSDEISDDKPKNSFIF